MRALEPLQGIEKMKSRRLANKKKACDKMKEKEICSGPSKLCQVNLSISLDHLYKLARTKHILANKLGYVKTSCKFLGVK